MLLLVEDDINITQSLEFALKNNNFQVVSVSYLEEIAKVLENKKIEVIILDVNLPDGNAYTYYEENLKDRGIPVIFLTALDGEDDIVRGLELGADDYVTKPFSTKELVARIKKIILRKKQQNIIKVQDISYDLDKMVVMKGSKVINLSALELMILNLLFININKVVYREVLLDKIWEATGNDVDSHTITVYLKRIREKLGSDIIKTIKGVGYRIDEE